jgi:hypothetical protein
MQKSPESPKSQENQESPKSQESQESPKSTKSTKEPKEEEPPKPSSAKRTREDVKSCPTCTYDNGLYATKCAVCEQPLQPEEEKIRPCDESFEDTLLPY